MARDRRLRVLLVDDEPDMLALLQAVIPTETWEVVGRASNGLAAMRIANDIVPDLAVVDYMMPGENGLRVAEQLKALHPQCRIILFSALDLQLEAAQSPFVDSFVRKGDLKRLYDALEAVAADVSGE